MKKILLFAFALAAGVMAFTSCDKNKIDSPIVGTWGLTEGEFDRFYTFNGDGTFQRIEDYYMNGRNVVAHEHIVGEGTFTINGDIVETTIPSITIYMDGSKEGDDFGEFWPKKESMKFKVDGKTLTLTHDYDTEDAWSETYTKKLQ